MGATYLCAPSSHLGEKHVRSQLAGQVWLSPAEGLPGLGKVGLCLAPLASLGTPGHGSPWGTGSTQSQALFMGC